MGKGKKEGPRGLKFNTCRQPHYYMEAPLWCNNYEKKNNNIEREKKREKESLTYNRVT